MSLRFFSGGGQPPQSHEVLLVEADGEGWYLTGMPWPEQPPFNEIGRYRVELAAGGYERLAALARAVIAEPEPEAGYADSGSESVRLDEAEASWSPPERSAGAQAFVDAAREAITAARARPDAVARAELGDGRVTLTNRGEQPLPVAGGEVRAGWGPDDQPPRAAPARLRRAGRGRAAAGARSGRRGSRSRSPPPRRTRTTTSPRPTRSSACAGAKASPASAKSAKAG